MSSPSRGQTPTDDVGSGRQPVARSAPGGSLTGRALIFFTVLGLLVVALSVPVRNWLTQRAEVASLRSDIASSTEQIELLNSELDRWSDPAFISSEARRRLHFLLPGETGYITISRDGRPAESLLSDDVAQIPQGWHSVLWESVQRADGPPAVSPKSEDGA